MSVKQDVIDLLATAKDELLRIEGLAVSERNRVLDGLAHALEAATTMVVDEPAPKPAEAEVERPAPVVEAEPAPVAASAPKVPAAESSSGS